MTTTETIRASLDATAGALRVLALDLRPAERSADYYAAEDIASAVESLERAARALREGETFETARAFGG